MKRFVITPSLFFRSRILCVGFLFSALISLGGPLWGQVVYTGAFKAINNNNLAELKSLIEADKSVVEEKLPAIGQTPLVFSVVKNRLDSLQLLLDSGANPNGQSKNGQTALQLALMRRRTNMVTILLESGADVSIADKNGLTPLMYAVMYRAQPDTVNEFLSRGANPLDKNRSGLTVLQMACNYNQPESALLILKSLGQSSVEGEQGKSVFWAACSSGMKDVAAQMIEWGVDVQAINTDKQSPLHLACRSSSAELAQLLISKSRSSLNSLDSRGFTPLWYAVSSGQLKTVQALLDSNADPNLLGVSPGQVMLKPLEQACTMDRPDLVVALVEGGADPNSKTKDGYSPLHLFVDTSGQILSASSTRNPRRPGQQSRAVKIKAILNAMDSLIEKGAGVDRETSDGKTALALAAESGFFDGVEALVEKSTKFDFSVGDGNLLHWAAENGLTKTCARLLPSIDVESKNSQGQTPALVAAATGQLVVLEQLKNAGAKMAAVDSGGQSAIHLGAQYDQTEVVPVFVNAGVDINLADESGQTALHHAAWNGAAATVRVLIDNGANANLKTSTGYTSLMAAAWNGHAGIVRQICRGGAKVDDIDDDGWSALHKAAFRGHVPVVKILLAAGATVDLKNKAGMTSAAVAGDRNHVEIVELLKNPSSPDAAKSQQGKKENGK